MATILITGASGLIGTALSRSLVADGHRLHHLGRSLRPDTGHTRHFRWNPVEGTIDEACLHGVTHIVHLAGAGIAEKRWTRSRITELIDSRAASARLLLRTVSATGSRIDAMISAAGMNYYGACTSERVHQEADPPGTDTIARICVEWERAVDEWGEVTRVAKLRTPLVLARSGGALPMLAAPVRWGAGAALGSGRQWMPWVHMDDLTRAYKTALFHVDYEGAFHVNAGHDVTNIEFMRTLAAVLHKPFFLPRVPAFALRIALGELSSVVLHGSRASNARLLSKGFLFQHNNLRSALEDLLR